MTKARSLNLSIEPLEATPDLVRDLHGIQFACSRFFREGWLNTDIEGFVEQEHGRHTCLGGLYRIDDRYLFHQLDATVVMPYPNAAFACAYAEHFVEHIRFEQAGAWLRETRRVIAPGGVIRLTTPDLALYARGYTDPDGDFFTRHHAHLTKHRKFRDAPKRRAWLMNQLFYFWGHCWIYDFEELEHLAVCAGFEPGSVRKCEFRSGDIVHLADLDMASRSDETIYVEIDCKADK